MLGAFKDEHVSLDCDGIDGKHNEEVERRTVHFSAGQTVTEAYAIRLASYLEPDLAARTAAGMDAAGHSWHLRRLHQPRLVHGGADEGGEERVRAEGPRFELGVELDADEPGMVGHLHDLRQ
jgi:hypothetical protein